MVISVHGEEPSHRTREGDVGVGDPSHCLGKVDAGDNLRKRLLQHGDGGSTLLFHHGPDARPAIQLAGGLLSGYKKLLLHCVAEANELLMNCVAQTNELLMHCHL